MLGTGPIIGFKFNISYEEYVEIQDQSFMTLMKIFPGIAQFSEDNRSIFLKGFGKNKVRKCLFGDNDIQKIIIQRISVIQDEKARKELEGNGIEQLQLHHSFYNIIPNFMIPNKHYHAELVCRCAKNRRDAVLATNEEYPSVRQTFRWAKLPEHPDDYAPGTGTIVVFDKDDDKYREIIRIKEVREWIRKMNNEISIEELIKATEESLQELERSEQEDKELKLNKAVLEKAFHTNKNK